MTKSGRSTSIELAAKIGGFGVGSKNCSPPPKAPTVCSISRKQQVLRNSAMRPTAAGRLIGNYKLLEKIGEGGMGSVYLAEQLRPVQRKVALKLIRAGLDSSQVVARFEAERQSLAMMDHPNIAKVLDAGETDQDEPYFVMELVKGLPITEYCDANRLGPKERVELMVDVCGAVQHAHQKGVIHRDLKPSNILVAQYDDRPVPKVIDFGVAKATHQKLTEKTLYTQLGQIVGTLEYMSPEQAVLNQLDVDTRSDVYSLGVILYELLVGETPLDAKELRSQGLEQMLRTIREKEPARPSLRLSSQGKAATQTAAYRHTDQSSLSKTLRGDLDWIVMKALEKDRKRRYESASRLAEDLGNYLGGTTVDARPPTVGYRLGKYVHRNRVGLSLASILFAILTIAVVSVARERNVAEEARNVAEQEKNVAVGRLKALQLTLEELAFNEACNGDRKQFDRWHGQLKAIKAPQGMLDTLEAIALLTSGDEAGATKRLKEVIASDSNNQLANAAMVWAAIGSGDYSAMDDTYERISELGEGDDDFSRLLISFATAPQPGVADEKAIEKLTAILERHPRWGFAYQARSYAYLDLCNRTKSPRDLHLAIQDMRVARMYMPDSEFVKRHTMETCIESIAFAQAFPERLSEDDLRHCRGEADRIANEFYTSPSSFEGCVTALMYYRLINDEKADEMETRLENNFNNAERVAAEAFADKQFEELLRDDPDRPFIRSFFQALAQKELGNDEGAIETCNKLSERAFGNGNLSEISLDGFLLLRDEEGFRRTLKQAQEGFFFWEWERKPLDLYTGKITPEMLVAEAHPFPYQMCVAHYTVGMHYLCQGNRDLAKEHFRNAVQTGRYGWSDYHAAKAFLKRLEDPSDDFPEWIPDVSATVEVRHD